MKIRVVIEYETSEKSYPKVIELVRAIAEKCPHTFKMLFLSVEQKEGILSVEKVKKSP